MKYLVVLCSVLLIPLAQSDGQDAAELLLIAEEWLEKGELDSAEKMLIESVETNPTLGRAYHLLGLVYLRRYDLDKTREYLLTSIEIEGHNQEYRDTYERVRSIASGMAGAKRSLEGGDPFVAIGKYEALMEEYPEVSAMILYHMGLASMRADDVSGAARYFREAVTRDPAYDKPEKALEGITARLYNKGNQILLRGDYQGVAEHYEQALELNPSFHKALYHLGLVHTKVGEFDKAMDYYQKTVDVAPSYAKGWFALALAHQRNGDIDKALEALQHATSADPAYARAYTQQGVIYVKQGNLVQAERAYNQAIQADPTYVRPYENLGNIYVRQEKYAQAVLILTTATALDPSSEEGWYMLAQSYNALENCESAKEAAHSAIGVKETYAPAWFELGSAEACLGNKTAALNAFEKARRDRSWRKAAEYEIDRIKNPEKYGSS